MSGALPTISYVLADVAGDGRIALAAVSDDPAARDVFHALAFVRGRDGRWSGCQMSNRLVGLHLSRPGDPFDAIGIGIDGGVCRLAGVQQDWTLMERGSAGPSTLVPLVTSRRVGDVVVATGMQRRTYAGWSSAWSRIDDGLRIPPDDLAISGLMSVDGTGPDQLWAAGYGGEIWTRRGSAWSRVDSPTNVKLVALRQLPDGSVMVGGAKGTVFLGRQSAWTPVEGLESYLATGIENFADRTYVIVQGGALYVLDGLRLVRVDELFDFPVYAMSACATSLLVVGPFGLRLLDGTGWHEVVPPIPAPPRP